MKKRVLFACLAALCSLTMVAQTVVRIVPTPEKSAFHVPRHEAPASLKKIYSNLGKPGEIDLYNDSNIWPVLGPDSIVGFAWFTALPFTPKSDSHISQVQVAVQYGGNGANQLDLSIHADTNGAPGALLAGPVTVTNLPDTGTCCSLVVANFSTLAVTGGTQYWVVADTPLAGTGSDFAGGWACVSKPVMLLAGSSGGGPWGAINGDGRPAGEVLGTIP